VKVHAAGADTEPGWDRSSRVHRSGSADAGRGSHHHRHQNVQNRLSAPTGQVAAYRRKAGPPTRSCRAAGGNNYNGEGVEVFWMPNRKHDGDSIVHFRRSDVIATGDIFTTTQYPFIDIRTAAVLQGEIAALNNIPR